MVKTILKIEGMACSMCESHINDTIRNSFSVKKVSSSHSKGEAVIISEDKLDEEALKAAISATGYNVTGITVQPYEKKGLFGFLKK